MTEERDFLEEHRRDCAACRANPESVDDALWLLTADQAIDARALTKAARARLAPVLAERQAEVWRRHVTIGLVLAVIPLPFVVAWGGFFGSWLFVVASAVLPTAIVGYALGTYAAAVVLLIGLTYASIPLLMSGRSVVRPLIPKWNSR